MFLQLRRPKHKRLPTEVFSRIARPKVFTTGATDAKMYANRIFSAPGAAKHFCNWREWCKNDADQKVFAPGLTKNFNDWRERCKNECRPKIFLRLARTMQKWRTTEVFLPLVRPKIYPTGANDAKMNADRSVFAPSATESFFDWRGRSISVRRPQFFCDWGDRSTSYRQRKCFRAWRDQKFLRIARPKCFRDWRVRKFLRQARPT